MTPVLASCARSAAGSKLSLSCRHQEGPFHLTRWLRIFRSFRCTFAIRVTTLWRWQRRSIFVSLRPPNMHKSAFPYLFRSQFKI